MDICQRRDMVTMQITRRELSFVRFSEGRIAPLYYNVHADGTWSITCFEIIDAKDCPGAARLLSLMQRASVVHPLR